MPEETAPLVARLRRRERVAFGGRRAVRGTLEGRAVIVAETGDGMKAAARAAEELIARFSPAALLGLGVAGALSAGLAAGAVGASSNVRDEAGATLTPDPELLRGALGAGAEPVRLVTLDRVLATSEEKRRVAAKLDGGPWAVDMESFAWASAAAAHGVRWIVIRAMLDGVEDDLPRLLSAARREDGGVDRARVALGALRHPGLIPGLLGLKRRVAASSRALADIAARLVRDTSPPA
jgi:nucleoside phosphorylase